MHTNCPAENDLRSLLQLTAPLGWWVIMNQRAEGSGVDSDLALDAKVTKKLG